MTLAAAASLALAILLAVVTAADHNKMTSIHRKIIWKHSKWREANEHKFIRYMISC